MVLWLPTLHDALIICSRYVRQEGAHASYVSKDILLVYVRPTVSSLASVI